MRWLNILRLRDSSDADLDSPAGALRARDLIQRKSFLRELYLEFYRVFERAIPPAYDGRMVVELGSGGGFIKEVIPDVLTTDVLDVPGLDMHFSACDMPFPDGSVDAFLMIDVLHHLPDSARFFKEADRCLKSDGRIILVEPANTWWGRFVYTRFHHEAFDPSAGWGLAPGGPLSSANGALPWIIFCRDREKFEAKFPRLHVSRVEAHTPVRYLLSGGLSYRQLAPSWTFPWVTRIEQWLGTLNQQLGMFYTILVVKRSNRNRHSPSH